jgi:phospholipid/cholesterol/gamma-HCH transport system substrate-binding protein
VRKGVAFGVFAAFSLALTFYIAAQIAHFQVGTSRYSLTATFDDVMNLSAGNPVRLAGVPVGQVSSVKAVRGRAEVRFNVDRSVKLANDSQVSVRWLNLIGQRELYLTPGTAAARLGDGDRMTRTRSVVDLGELFNKLGPITQSLNPAQINDLVRALVTAFDGNRGSVNAIVGDLATVLRSLAERKDTISQLLGDYNVVTGEVARRDRQIQTMVDNLATLSATFGQSQQVLDDALVTLPRLTAGLQAVLGVNADQLGRIVDNLSKVTGTVHAHLGDVETTINGFTPSLAGLFDATRFGQFAGVNVTCVSVTPPPCPHPIVVATSRGPGPLDSPARFRAALLGGLG